MGNPSPPGGAAKLKKQTSSATTKPSAAAGPHRRTPSLTSLSLDIDKDVQSPQGKGNGVPGPRSVAATSSSPAAAAAAALGSGVEKSSVSPAAKDAGRMRRRSRSSFGGADELVRGLDFSSSNSPPVPEEKKHPFLLARGGGSRNVARPATQSLTSPGKKMATTPPAKERILGRATSASVLSPKKADASKKEFVSPRRAVSASEYLTLNGITNSNGGDMELQSEGSDQFSVEEPASSEKSSPRRASLDSKTSPRLSLKSKADATAASKGRRLMKSPQEKPSPPPQLGRGRRLDVKAAARSAEVSRPELESFEVPAHCEGESKKDLKFEEMLSREHPRQQPGEASEDSATPLGSMANPAHDAAAAGDDEGLSALNSGEEPGLGAENELPTSWLSEDLPSMFSSLSQSRQPDDAVLGLLGDPPEVLNGGGLSVDPDATEVEAPEKNQPDVEIPNGLDASEHSSTFAEEGERDDAAEGEAAPLPDALQLAPAVEEPGVVSEAVTGHDDEGDGDEDGNGRATRNLELPPAAAAAPPVSKESALVAATSPPQYVLQVDEDRTMQHHGRLEDAASVVDADIPAENYAMESARAAGELRMSAADVEEESSLHIPLASINVSAPGESLQAFEGATQADESGRVVTLGGFSDLRPNGPVSQVAMEEFGVGSPHLKGLSSDDADLKEKHECSSDLHLSGPGSNDAATEEDVSIASSGKKAVDVPVVQTPATSMDDILPTASAAVADPQHGGDEVVPGVIATRGLTPDTDEAALEPTTTLVESEYYGTAHLDDVQATRVPASSNFDQQDASMVDEELLPNHECAHESSLSDAGQNDADDLQMNRVAAAADESRTLNAAQEDARKDLPPIEVPVSAVPTPEVAQTAPAAAASSPQPGTSEFTTVRACQEQPRTEKTAAALDGGGSGALDAAIPSPASTPPQLDIAKSFNLEEARQEAALPEICRDVVEESEAMNTSAALDDDDDDDILSSPARPMTVSAESGPPHQESLDPSPHELVEESGTAGDAGPDSSARKSPPTPSVQAGVVDAGRTAATTSAPSHPAERNVERSIAAQLSAQDISSAPIPSEPGTESGTSLHLVPVASGESTLAADLHNPPKKGGAVEGDIAATQEPGSEDHPSMPPTLAACSSHSPPMELGPSSRFPAVLEGASHKKFTPDPAITADEGGAMVGDAGTQLEEEEPHSAASSAPFFGAGEAKEEEEELTEAAFLSSLGYEKDAPPAHVDAGALGLDKNGLQMLEGADSPSEPAANLGKESGLQDGSTDALARRAAPVEENFGCISSPTPSDRILDPATHDGSFPEMKNAAERDGGFYQETSPEKTDPETGVAGYNPFEMGVGPEAMRQDLRAPGPESGATIGDEPVAGFRQDDWAVPSLGVDTEGEEGLEANLEFLRPPSGAVEEGNDVATIPGGEVKRSAEVDNADDNHVPTLTHDPASDDADERKHIVVNHISEPEGSPTMQGDLAAAAESAPEVPEVEVPSSQMDPSKEPPEETKQASGVAVGPLFAGAMDTELAITPLDRDQKASDAAAIHEQKVGDKKLPEEADGGRETVNSEEIVGEEEQIGRSGGPTTMTKPQENGLISSLEDNKDALPEEEPSTLLTTRSPGPAEGSDTAEELLEIDLSKHERPAQCSTVATAAAPVKLVEMVENHDQSAHGKSDFGEFPSTDEHDARNAEGALETAEFVESSPPAAAPDADDDKIKGVEGDHTANYELQSGSGSLIGPRDDGSRGWVTGDPSEGTPLTVNVDNVEDEAVLPSKADDAAESTSGAMVVEDEQSVDAHVGKEEACSSEALVAHMDEGREDSSVSVPEFSTQEKSLASEGTNADQMHDEKEVDELGACGAESASPVEHTSMAAEDDDEEGLAVQRGEREEGEEDAASVPTLATALGKSLTSEVTNTDNETYDDRKEVDKMCPPWIAKLVSPVEQTDAINLESLQGNSLSPRSITMEHEERQVPPTLFPVLGQPPLSSSQQDRLWEEQAEAYSSGGRGTPTRNDQAEPSTQGAMMFHSPSASPRGGAASSDDQILPASGPMTLNGQDHAAAGASSSAAAAGENGGAHDKTNAGKGKPRTPLRSLLAEEAPKGGASSVDGEANGAAAAAANGTATHSPSFIKRLLRVMSTPSRTTDKENSQAKLRKTSKWASCLGMPQVQQ